MSVLHGVRQGASGAQETLAEGNTGQVCRGPIWEMGAIILAGNGVLLAHVKAAACPHGWIPGWPPLAHLYMGGHQADCGHVDPQMMSVERISAPGSSRIYTQGTAETALRCDSGAIPVEGNSRLCSNVVSRDSCPPCWVFEVVCGASPCV